MAQTSNNNPLTQFLMALICMGLKATTLFTAWPLAHGNPSHNQNYHQNKKDIKNIKDIQGPSPMEVLEVIYDPSIYFTDNEEATFGATQFLSPKKLKRFDYGDPMRLLQSVPGIHLQEEDGFGLRPNIGLRGATPHRSKKITLMEDGVPIAPAPYSAPAAYFFPNITKTHSIEIFKGLDSVKYGPNSIGGALHFKTHPIPDKTLSRVGINYGRVQKYAFSTGDTQGPWGYLLEYHRMESDGFKKLPQGEKTGFNKDDFMWKGSYQKGRHRILMKTAYAREKSHETYLGLTEEDFAQSAFDRYAASAKDLMKWSHQQHQLKYSLAASHSVDIQASLYYHHLNRKWSKINGFQNGAYVADYLNPQSQEFHPHFLRVLRGESDSILPHGGDQLVMGHNHRKYDSGGISLETSYFIKHSSFFNSSKSIAHHVSLGLRHHQDQVKRRHTSSPFEMKEGSLHRLAWKQDKLRGQIKPKGQDRLEEQDTPQLDTENTDISQAQTLVFEDDVSFPMGVQVSVRARWENIKTRHKLPGQTSRKNHDQLFVPGIGLQYIPTENLNVMLSVNKGMSVVSPGQVSSVRPEESVNYEMGLKYESNLRRSDLRKSNLYKSKLSERNTYREKTTYEENNSYEKSNIYGESNIYTDSIYGGVIGFYSDYTNIKGFCSFSSGCEQKNLDHEFNGGKAEIYGLESHVGANFKVFSLNIPVDISYTRTIAQFLNHVTSTHREWGLGLIRKKDPLPYIPEHKLSLSLGTTWNQISSFFIYNWQSLIYDQAVQEGRRHIDAHGVMDWMGKYEYSPHGNAFLRVENLFAKQYMVSLRPYGARPGKPQSVSLGFKHTF